MSNGYDYRRHGGDFPNCSDAEIELLECALTTYVAIIGGCASDLPREHRDAFSSLFLKARNAAAQRKIPPHGG